MFPNTSPGVQPAPYQSLSYFHPLYGYHTNLGWGGGEGSLPGQILCYDGLVGLKRTPSNTQDPVLLDGGGIFLQPAHPSAGQAAPHVVVNQQSIVNISTPGQRFVETPGQSIAQSGCFQNGGLNLGNQQVRNISQNGSSACFNAQSLNRPVMIHQIPAMMGMGHENSVYYQHSVVPYCMTTPQGSNLIIQQGSNCMQPNGLPLPYNAVMHNGLMMHGHLPAVMPMNFNTSPSVVPNNSGTFQELMHKVTTGNCSEKEHGLGTSTSISDKGNGDAECANKSNDGSGTAAVESDDATEDSVQDDREDEHNDADDEMADQIVETECNAAEEEAECMAAEGETETRRMANIDISAYIPEEQTTYEIIELNKDGHDIAKKRRRFPKGYIIPESRTPRDIGTIEKAMRNASKRGSGCIFEPKLGMVFDSRAEAYNFYNLFSWEVGFGIRFGSFAKNRVNQMRTMQEIVCEKEGFDRRCKTNSKRVRCKAMIRMHRTEDMGWYVSKHVSQHNHPVSVSPGEKREWRSHSKIEQCTKDIIGYLRDSNVSLSNVHCFMGRMYGRMEDVPFNPGSIRAVCSQIARDQKQDDISKTLEVFRKMRAEDPGFQFSVDRDEENKIKTLIWATGRSRCQYNFFGDAITFDTTYCTNIYKMPFGMFVGVNNHFQSIIFAGVLMIREDAESFNWVFKEFIELMGGKHPVTILTDQCKAMTKAIREVFTEQTTHLWCKWHVLRYAPEELGPIFTTNAEFRRDFQYIINQMLTIDEFERGWDDLLETYKLRDNEFLKRTYEKKHMWAKPWARNTFCARMASTQRSESANSLLKKVVPRNSSMNKFVEQYNRLLFMRARAEEKEEHMTKQFVHRTKRMYGIEKHAITVYTRKCFELFSEEVDKSTEYDVEEADEDGVYFVVHNNAETRKRWARVIFTVTVDDDGEKHTCECGQYEHFGILCCHAIKVMIVGGLKKIPECHILKRWTRDARDYEYPSETCTEVDKKLGRQLLFANALDVVNFTENSQEAAKILADQLNIARQKIQKLRNETMSQDSESDGKLMSEYNINSSTEENDTDHGSYDSDLQQVGNNTYGASGSSAYMSDVEIRDMKAPSVAVKPGRRRTNRRKSLFERPYKGRKRYTGSPIVCDRCGEEGHVASICVDEVTTGGKKATKGKGKGKRAMN